MKNDTIKLIITETLLIENKKSTKKDSTNKIKLKVNNKNNSFTLEHDTDYKINPIYKHELINKTKVYSFSINEQNMNQKKNRGYFT